MNNFKKTLVLFACAVLLVAGSVFGTFAYLTDNDSVTNTFTVGQVHLKLDEALVSDDGMGEIVLDKDDNETRVKENSYRLLPGHTYSKDPTVTVLANSEESYVRMFVTFNFSSQLDAIFGKDGADLNTIFNGYDGTNWSLYDDVEDTAKNTRTYEFRYVGTDNKGSKDGTVKKADGTPIVLDDLFESFTVPGFLTNEQLATLVVYGEDENGNLEIKDQFTITVVAHAIQADGFADADAAWAEFTPSNS